MVKLSINREPIKIAKFKDLPLGYFQIFRENDLTIILACKISNTHYFNFLLEKSIHIEDPNIESLNSKNITLTPLHSGDIVTIEI